MTSKAPHPKTTPDTPDTPEAPEAPEAPAAETAAGGRTVVGGDLQPGEAVLQVKLSAHLRIDGRDYRPGQTISVSAATRRRLARNGYLARG